MGIQVTIEDDTQGEYAEIQFEDEGGETVGVSDVTVRFLERFSGVSCLLATNNSLSRVHLENLLSKASHTTFVHTLSCIHNDCPLKERGILQRNSENSMCITVSNAFGMGQSYIERVESTKMYRGMKLAVNDAI